MHSDNVFWWNPTPIPPLPLFPCVSPLPFSLVCFLFQILWVPLVLPLWKGSLLVAASLEKINSTPPPSSHQLPRVMGFKKPYPAPSSLGCWLAGSCCAIAAVYTAILNPWGVDTWKFRVRIMYAIPYLVYYRDFVKQLWRKENSRTSEKWTKVGYLSQEDLGK